MRNVQVVDQVPHSVPQPVDVVVAEVEGEAGEGRHGVVCHGWHSSQVSVTTVYDYLVCMRIMMTGADVWALVLVMTIVVREGA